MFDVKIMLNARRDLEEIQEYLSQFGKSRPEKFMEKFWDLAPINYITFGTVTNLIRRIYMQAALLGTYSNGIVELDEPIAKENGNRVVVVFLDKPEKMDASARKKSVDKMCGIYAGMVPYSVTDDFIKNKQVEKELEG